MRCGIPVPVTLQIGFILGTDRADTSVYHQCTVGYQLATVIPDGNRFFFPLAVSCQFRQLEPFRHPEQSVRVQVMMLHGNRSCTESLIVVLGEVVVFRINAVIMPQPGRQIVGDGNGIIEVFFVACQVIQLQSRAQEGNG